MAQAFEGHELSKMAEGTRELHEHSVQNMTGDWVVDPQLSFEWYVNNEKEKSEVLGILETTKTNLRALGEEISVGELSRIDTLRPEELHGKRSIPVQTKSLITTVEIIEKMIRGEWTEPNNYGVWFEGFPYPNGAQTI